MATALFVSPHLDDVAFSCGGTLAELGRQGWRTVVVTAFTASVPDPTGFALACQVDKGLPADVDYMALRRIEDLRAARCLGARRLLWFDLPEAPHRGYDSAAALFGDTRADDDGAELVACRLADVVDEERPDVMFAPQALGSHVDHRAVVRAVVDVVADVVWTSVHWYRDTPYVIRDPDAQPPLPLPGRLVERAVPIAATLDVKVDAALAYTTQIGFQFGGPEACAAALRQHARAEGERAGCDGPAERFLVSLSAAR